MYFPEHDGVVFVFEDANHPASNVSESSLYDEPYSVILTCAVHVAGDSRQPDDDAESFGPSSSFCKEKPSHVPRFRSPFLGGNTAEHDDNGLDILWIATLVDSCLGSNVQCLTISPAHACGFFRYSVGEPTQTFPLVLQSRFS